MPFFTLKDGAKLFYKEEGSGSPPLVLVHFMSGNSWFWNKQVPYFSKFYRVIAPDLKGHGASDKPQAPYSMGEFAEELNQLFDKLLGKEKFVLCGHSMGGYIALTYATDPVFSKRLKGVILCNAAYAHKGDPTMKAMLDLLKKGASSLWLEVVRSSFNAKFQKEHKNIVRAAAEESLKCPDHVKIDCLKSIAEEYDLTGKLSQIEMPVLIITSDADGGVDPKQSSYMKEHIKNSQLVVLKPAIGHYTPLEAKDEFNKAVKSFMDKLK
nr:alpha/beta hydrolase [Candidatus Njordarchaeum guaymaensis]